MPLIEKATAYILDALLQNEEFKKFPQDFISESVKWVRSWFLTDDPKTEAKLSSGKSKDYKAGVVESKLEDLLENPQFKQELERKLLEYERHAASIQHHIQQQNVVQNSPITAGGNVEIGDRNISAGGNVQIIHQYAPQPQGHPVAPAVPLTKPAVPADVKANLQQLVASNRVTEVIRQLSALSAGHGEFQKLVLAQSQRWDQLERQVMLNTLSFSEAGVERGKVVAALLDLIGELG